MTPGAHDEVLAACEVFAGLPPELLAELVEAAAERVVEPDSVAWSEGEPADVLAVVASGLLRATLTGSEGDVFLMDLFGPGDAAGVLDVLDDGPRSATATARGRTRLVVIPNDVVRGVLARHPETLARLTGAAVDIARSTRAGMRDLLFLDLLGRLAKLVLRVTEQGRDLPGEPLNQQEIATMLGARRQSVNAALADLRRRGTVAVERGLVTDVLDRDGLRRLAGLPLALAVSADGADPTSP